MFIDSHCHLDFPELRADLPRLTQAMADNEVTHALCISVNLQDFPGVLAVARTQPQWYASVGVHPDHELAAEPEVGDILALAEDPKVVAIGETGLDYYRLTGDLGWQRERFRRHIRAARACDKPLVIHTRSSAEDTLRILEEEGASAVGGVMHCFTETWEVAQRALDLGFYISFSGIVTFRNAVELKAVAQQVPLDRMLIETDAPFLAPVPHRGKPNQPAWVKHVAEEVARLRDVSLETIAVATSANFLRLFRVAG